MEKVSVRIKFLGHKLTVNGNYCARFAGTTTQPAEPPSFSVLSICGTDCGDAILTLTDPEAEAEFLALCIKQHEEDLAYAEQEATDRRIELQKDAA